MIDTDLFSDRESVKHGTAKQIADLRATVEPIENKLDLPEAGSGDDLRSVLAHVLAHEQREES